MWCHRLGREASRGRLHQDRRQALRHQSERHSLGVRRQYEEENLHACSLHARRKRQ